MRINRASARLQRAASLVVLLILLVCSNSQISFAAPLRSGEMVLLIWPNYINPELLTEFEAEENISIRSVEFGSEEGRDSMVFKGATSDFDVMILGGAALEPYARRKWLTPLADVDIPNRKHLDPRFTTTFDAAEAYAIPYFWGTTGIAYRSDLVSGPVHSWRQLIEPHESLRGKIGMLSTGRDIVSPVLKILGHSLNPSTPKIMREVEPMLRAQKPYVQTYDYVGSNDKALLVNGVLWMTMMYNGDALNAREIEPRITYVVPDEGALMWIDFIAISAGSSRQALAARFIDFLNRPEIAARNAEFLHYATPNIAARSLLSDDHRNDPLIYPDDSLVERSEVQQPLSPRVRKTLNEIMDRLIE